MAVSIAKLAIQFVADTSGMVAGTKKAESALGGFVGKVKNIGGALAGAFGFVGPTAALVGFVASVRKSFRELDALGDSSKRLGIGVENLQLLAYAAGQSGVETESLNKAFVKMNDTIGEAALGSKGAVTALERLGLSAKTLQAQDPKEAFISLAEAIAKVPDHATRTKLAMDVFGKSAADLLPLLMEGREGIEAMFAEREGMGLSLEEDVKRVQEMDDAWNRMGVAISQASKDVSVVLAPAMEAFANATTQALKDIRELHDLEPLTDKQKEDLQGGNKVGELPFSNAAKLALDSANKEAMSRFDRRAAAAPGQQTSDPDWFGFGGGSAAGNAKERRMMDPKAIAEAGRQTMEAWAKEDAMGGPSEAVLRGLDNIATANALGALAGSQQNSFAAGKDADKLFGRLKKPVVGTIGDLLGTIDRKANAAIGGVTGTIGDSAAGNLLDSAKAGLESFAKASGQAKANVDALSASPAMGGSSALQSGTAAAFSQARQNFADQQRAEEMKQTEKQTKALEKIESNTLDLADSFKKGFQIASF